MANANKKPKPLSQCDAKFVAWAEKNKITIPDVFKDDPTYKIWLSAWRVAYAVGLQRGHEQREKQYYIRSKRLRPLSFSEMEELFEGCTNGRQFGLRIEERHGIL